MNILFVFASKAKIAIRTPLLFTIQAYSGEKNILAFGVAVLPFVWKLLCVFVSARLDLFCCVTSFKCGRYVGPSQVSDGCGSRLEQIARF